MLNLVKIIQLIPQHLELSFYGANNARKDDRSGFIV